MRLEGTADQLLLDTKLNPNSEGNRKTYKQKVLKEYLVKFKASILANNFIFKRKILWTSLRLEQTADQVLLDTKLNPNSEGTRKQTKTVKGIPCEIINT